MRLHVQCQVALIQTQIDLLDANLNIYAHVQNRRRRRRLWSRAWLGSERRRQFGLYDQLMIELRREDQKSFVKFMRMQPEMFDKILECVGPRITKQYTFYRAPVDPRMKLAVTLRHLASGSKYTSMQFGWRAPHNAISDLFTCTAKSYSLRLCGSWNKITSSQSSRQVFGMAEVQMTNFSVLKLALGKLLSNSNTLLLFSLTWKKHMTLRGSTESSRTYMIWV